MSNSRIAHAALDGHLAKLPDLPPVAWENDGTFKPPPDGSIYLRVAFLPGDSEYNSLGEQGTTIERGIYQVGISAPGGKGSGKAEELADRIVAHFKRKTIGVVRVRLPKRSQAMPDEGRIWLAVTIPYFTETFF